MCGEYSSKLVPECSHSMLHFRKGKKCKDLLHGVRVSAPCSASNQVAQKKRCVQLFANGLKGIRQAISPKVIGLETNVIHTAPLAMLFLLE